MKWREIRAKKNCGCSSTLRSHLLMLKSPKKGYVLFQWVACEQQTHFRSSEGEKRFASLPPTTGNASAVRRLFNDWLN